jgi:hypothetical protein
MGFSYSFNEHFGFNGRMSFPLGVTGLTPTFTARLQYIL